MNFVLQEILLSWRAFAGSGAHPHVNTDRAKSEKLRRRRVTVFVVVF